MTQNIRNRRNADSDGTDAMTILRETAVDGEVYPVTVSDESEALLAAKAAGRAIVGIWRPDMPVTPGLEICLYLVTDPGDVTDELLERAVRRQLDRPWTIAVTERLLIREFGPGDPLEPESPYDGDGVFSDWKKREAYRGGQYRFCECGLWALEDRENGRIIGKAGLTGGELGYHIYPAFRGMGYAKEACRAVIRYGFEELGLPEIRLKIFGANGPSEALARTLGFEEARGEEGIRLLRIKKIGEEGKDEFSNVSV